MKDASYVPLDFFGLGGWGGRRWHVVGCDDIQKKISANKFVAFK